MPPSNSTQSTRFLRRPADGVRPHAFTLVEILIVVMILGILASLTIPQFSAASTDARQVAFKENLQHLVSAAQLYYNKYSALPAQTGGDPVPSVVMDELGDRGSFPLHTPLGGYWHIGYFPDLQRWGVGVWWPGSEPLVLNIVTQVDASIDDGNGSTGRFQTRDGARYYWMIN